MKGRLTSLISLSLAVAIIGYTSDASAYNTIKCNGNSTKWSSLPPQMRAATNSFPNGVWREALADAVSHWNTNPSKFYFNLTYDDSNIALNNGENEIWFSSDDSILINYPAVTYWWFKSDCTLKEADIIFDNRVSYTTSTAKSSLWDYGGSNRPFQTTASHELGHSLGLAHENRYYNIMGSDWTHVHTNAGIATNYPGEDASNGAVSLYGLYSTPLEELSVSHWKWLGTSGEYSTHTRTEMYNTSGAVLSSFTDAGEPIYNVNRGQQVQIELTYENNGANTKSFQVGFYISTNDNITTSDSFLGEAPYTLAKDTPYTAKNTVTIPSNLTPGKYYIGAIVDKNNVVGEVYEDNNSTYIPIKVN